MPNRCRSLKFYGLPKIHKDIPLRTYKDSYSPNYIRNTKDFVQQVKNIKLEEGDCITSYDFKALFAFVPVHPVIDIKKKLEQDAELLNRTSMSIPNIIALLGFCLKNTYFLFKVKYYE